MALILYGTDNNVSVPAIQGGTGGASAGIYYPSANTVAIVTGGVNAITANSTQAVSFANNVTVTGTLATRSQGITSTSLPAGALLQVVSTTLNTKFTFTGGGAGSWTNVTSLSATITPKSSTSKVLFIVNIVGGPSSQPFYLAGSQVIRGSTAVGVGATTSGYTSVAVGNMRTATDTNGGWSMAYNFLDSPATTSATTYQVQMLGENGVSYNLNTTGADTASQGYSTRGQSTITLMEIAA